MSTATVTESTAAAGSHGVEHALDPGSDIFGHILDAPNIEIPFTHMSIPLPQLLWGGTDPVFNNWLPTRHIVFMWLACIVLFLILRSAARKSDVAVPTGLRNALEPLIAFIRHDVAHKAIPHGADRFVGYLLTTFFFILACNLIGMIPGSATATGNIAVTGGLALAAFVVIQMGGIREYGPIKHIKNLVPHGLPLWLVPVIAMIELLSQFIRPFVLAVRLFANMMAGHVVILAFIFLIFIMGNSFSGPVGYAVSPVAVFFALFVHFLEILVAFLQAYIFTQLTATFIGMSVHPSH